MRIGEFAAKYGVSRDTVRFYINNGLLIPEDSGAQYQFGERECRDMETILRLKEWSFSLKEIREYMSVLRVSTMVEPESIQDIQDFFDHKKAKLEESIESLRKICDNIDAESKRLLQRDMPQRKKTGVPLQALPLLMCPYCGGDLTLEMAALDSRYVYQGTLRCDCGYQVQVENGIVKTGNLYTAPYDSPDLKRSLYRNVSENFVTYLQRCKDLALRELQQDANQKKIILEGHCNGYFFLYDHLKLLNRDNIYIITDKYPEVLEIYKRNIEFLNLNLNILYIADASIRYPLKYHCVDILIDFMGDNEHSLYFQNFYLQDMAPYLASDSMVLGAALSYSPNAKSLTALHRKYPEGSCYGYNKNLLEQYYRRAGYKCDIQPIGVILESSDQYSFECHQKGEKLYMDYFNARKNPGKKE